MIEEWFEYQRGLAAGMDAEARPDPGREICPECGSRIRLFWGIRDGEPAAIFNTHAPGYEPRLCPGSLRRADL